MADERIHRFAYDAIIMVVIIALLCVGIYYMRMPRVAILDVKRLAGETGAAEKMRKDEEKYMTAAAGRMGRLDEQLKTAMAAMESQLAKAADDSAKAKIRQDMFQLRARAQETAEQEKKEYQKYRESAYKSFRAAVDPVVMTIARSKHLDLVLDSQEGRLVMYARRKVDITDAAIKDSREALSKLDVGRVEQPGAAAAPPSPGPGKVR